jgi:hypothetical protein
MDISPDDAAQALSDIASARGRSQLLAGYHIAGPILILWGVVWAVAYTGMGVLPVDEWGYVWGPADLVGILGTILLSRRPRGPGAAGATWRVIGGMVLAAVFCAGLFSMIRSSDVNVYMAIPGLITGTIYAALGLWRMTRYLWVGALVIAASLVGFFVFPAILPFWMAATGGGGLIVSGLLFRRP